MGKITVLGLGPGSDKDISVRVLEKLKGSTNTYLRTKEHPVVENFSAWGIQFKSLDHYYNQYENFQDVYRAIVEHLIQEALKGKEIIYAVPGSPLVAESTTTLLRERSLEEGIELEIFPALSFLDVIYPLIKVDPTQGLQILDAMDLKVEQINSNNGLLICQVYNRLLASDLKLDLMEHYSDDHMIKVIRGAGIEDLEKIEELPLYQLDHLEWLDHLTSVYVPPQIKINPREDSVSNCQFPLDPLTEVMDKLLAPGGCPWDRKQDHHSLKRYLIEECYEVIEAIDNQDMHNLCEELGDLLLQVVFHGKLAEEKGNFDLNQVIQGVTEKMIRRHPHVFGDITVSGSTEVLKNWEMIKAQEKGNTVEKGILDNIPRGLPALMQALKIQEKAAQVGFDWPDIQGPWDKVYEEIRELKGAIEKQEQDKINAEFGDVLFALVNLARFLRIVPEEALLTTIRKFRSRFSFIEKQVKRTEQELKDMSLEELDYWWDLAKREET
ncbi:MAG: nucleoside triphosphate pyrophosphohydrolase [Clostridia bacterium]|jgi:tetrapyrrole methylase family protein/MazG family protein|nr:nucleoside triphosphate pyrophosphohydrolase [Clostridia bacterium]